jgi:drug/metabolite transporter (DMT)-like permease
MPRVAPVAVVWFGVVLFSTGPVIVAGAGISGVAFSFWRLWIGVLVLTVAVLVVRRGAALRVTRQGVGWSLASGVVFGIHQLALMTAVQRASVVDVTLMNTVAPVVVAFLAVPLFGERPGVRFRAWSLVAMAGAAGVVLAGSAGADGDRLGMALAVVNVVFYAFYFVGTKVARAHIDTVSLLLVAIVGAVLTVSAWVVLSGTAVTPIGRSDLLRCLAVAVLPGAVGHFSVTWALRWVPANVPPVIMLSMPVLSGALAWVVLGQGVRGGQVLAGAATVVGVLGAVRSSPSNAPEPLDEATILAEET